MLIAESQPVVEIKLTTPCSNTTSKIKRSACGFVKPAGRGSQAGFETEFCSLFTIFTQLSMLLYLITKVPLHSPHAFLCHELYVQINTFCLYSREVFVHVAQLRSVSFRAFSFLLSKSPPLSFVPNPTHESAVNRICTTLVL